MIRYEKLETGTPPDVKLFTDDANGEMSSLNEMFDSVDWPDAKTRVNLDEAKDRNADGLFEFIIPGDEVGEVSEFIYDIDNGLLESEIEKWNRMLVDGEEAES